MPGKNQTANPDLSWLNHVKLAARHADRAQQMPYVLTKYSHKYVIYVTLLKKVCSCQGEYKTDWRAILNPSRKEIIWKMWIHCYSIIYFLHITHMQSFMCNFHFYLSRSWINPKTSPILDQMQALWMSRLE